MAKEADTVEDKLGRGWGAIKRGWNNLTGEGGMFGDPVGTEDRQRMGHKAGVFAGARTHDVNRLGRALGDQRGYMEDIARGRESVSAMQLKQALQQNIAGQQAMANSARPGQGAMAARNAMMNAGQAASGLGGQQALAGIQERQSAQNALNQMLLQQRQQDMTGALGGMQNSITAFSPQGASGSDKQASGLSSFLTALAAMSDKRTKKDIKSGEADAEEFVKALKSYTFKYKDSKHGEGEQLGIMAQDLQRSKHGRQALIETDEGIAVHGPKLATAIASTLPGMMSRIEKLEGKKKGK